MLPTLAFVDQNPKAVESLFLSHLELTITNKLVHVNDWIKPFKLISTNKV